MPLLAAGIPVLAPPVVTGPTVSISDTRTLALRSLDGTDLMPFGGYEFFLQSGIQGLGMVPRELITEEIPGMDGSMLRQVKRTEREIFLPLYMAPSSGHLAFLADMQALEDLLTPVGTDYDLFDGDLDLVANSVDGNQERSLRITYEGGMEDGYGGGNSGPNWAALGMKFRAVQPYWRGQPWSTQPFAQPRARSWFGSFPGSLAPSRTLGTGVPFRVLGKRPSWPQMNLVGPATSVEIAGNGIYVTMPGGIATGETAVIVTDPRRRSVSFNGVEDWTRVGSSTTWQPLSPGDQTIDLLMTGTTSVSSIVLSGESYYERPW